MSSFEEYINVPSVLFPIINLNKAHTKNIVIHNHPYCHCHYHQHRHHHYHHHLFITAKTRMKPWAAETTLKFTAASLTWEMNFTVVC